VLKRLKKMWRPKMRRQYFIAGLTSVLTLMLTGRASVAFSIIPSQPGATSNWRPDSPYFIDGNRGGKTEVDTRLWTEPIPVGGTQKFQIVISLWAAISQRGFFGWDFQPVQQDLMGSFEIVNYLACGSQVFCGSENPNTLPKVGGVGATFYLKYRPAPTDPQPGQSKLHWIQMGQANYGGGLPGLLPNAPFIDNLSDRTDPYYDTVGESGEDFFQDRPYNSAPDAAETDNYFDAELYLVEETTPPVSQTRTVKVYNGIRWGWKNTVTYFPPSLPPLPCNGDSGGGGCESASISFAAVRQMLLLDSDGANTEKINNTDGSINRQLPGASQSPKSVPEPGSIVGLLALGIWSVRSLTKRKSGEPE
jgi:hypothetical protein